MRTSFQISMLFIVAALTACGANTQSNKWVNEPATVYPAKQYLSAVGEGDSRESAARRANANLARVFSVAIHETQLDKSHFATSQGGTNTDVTRHISLEARNELSGASVPQYYVDDKSGNVFAVAILEKSPAANRFRETINQADQQVEHLVNYARTQAPNIFSALSALKTARHHQWKRDNANRNLLVVSDIGVRTKITMADLEALIRDATSKLSFTVEGQDDFLVSQLSATAAELGVKLSNNAPLVLEANLDMEDPFEKSGWHWVRGSLVLTAKQDGAVVTQKRWVVKKSAQQQKMAKIRLRDHVAEQLPNYLIELLTSEPKGL